MPPESSLPGHGDAARLDEAAQRLLNDLKPRAKSLTVTIVGDSLAPHGGEFWLSGLIRLAAALGMNERLVRTVVLRLTREDWLRAEPIGRQSVYRVTETGWQRLSATRQRVYGLPRPRWDGMWRLVFLKAGTEAADKREKLKREMRWLGYGVVAPGVFAHPDTDFSDLPPLERALGFAGSLTAVTGAASRPGGFEDGVPGEEADLQFRAAWDLDQIAEHYAAFVARFEPLAGLIRAAAPDGQSAFVLRTLLIHEYRRSVLRDPALPEELMPDDWIGNRARALCGTLYRELERPTRQFLMRTVTTPDGALPPPGPDYYERFGGLAGA